VVVVDPAPLVPSSQCPSVGKWAGPLFKLRNGLQFLASAEVSRELAHGRLWLASGCGGAGPTRVRTATSAQPSGYVALACWRTFLEDDARQGTVQELEGRTHPPRPTPSATNGEFDFGTARATGLPDSKGPGSPPWVTRPPQCPAPVRLAAEAELAGGRRWTRPPQGCKALGLSRRPGQGTDALDSVQVLEAPTLFPPTSPWLRPRWWCVDKVQAELVRRGPAWVRLYQRLPGVCSLADGSQGRRRLAAWLRSPPACLPNGRCCTTTAHE
jgi:hypothetical protein